MRVVKKIRKSDQLLENLRRGALLPARFYIDRDIAELEKELFRRAWSYVAPTQRLQVVGDRVTGHLGDIPIVIVRSQDGIKGFINVCPHRRCQLVSETEVETNWGRELIVCPFHFWNFDLDGQLRGAPASANEDSTGNEFRKENYSLRPIKVGILGPWVFANADPEAEPFESCFGEVIPLIERSGLDLQNLQLYGKRQTWRYRANWKTVIETNVECYHCGGVHPGLNALLDMKSYQLKEYRLFSQQVGCVRRSALEGKSKTKIFSPIGPVSEAQSFFLWPCTTIEIYPGQHNASIAVSLPNGVDRTDGFNERYFGADVDTGWITDVLEFDERVWREDKPVVVGVQKGMSARTPARWLAPDRLCAHFQRIWINELVNLETLLEEEERLEMLRK